MSDPAQKLWLQLVEGSEHAFNTCFNRYWEELYHAAYWRVCNEELAKDLVQDVFVALWNKRMEIEITQSLPAYLQGMLRNHILNHFKAETRRQHHQEQAASIDHVVSPTPENEMWWKESLTRYQEAVERLPEKMRKIFVMRHEDSLDTTTTAEKLGISVQTVKNQYTAAVRRIKCELLGATNGKRPPDRPNLLALQLFF